MVDPLATIRRRRRQQFLNHLIAYFAVLVVVVPLNRVFYPDQLLFVVPMVAWGAPLAVHAAWVMELFGPPVPPIGSGASVTKPRHRRHRHARAPGHGRAADEAARPAGDTAPQDR